MIHCDSNCFDSAIMIVFSTIIDYCRYSIQLFDSFDFLVQATFSIMWNCLLLVSCGIVCFTLKVKYFLAYKNIIMLEVVVKVYF